MTSMGVPSRALTPRVSASKSAKSLSARSKSAQLTLQHRPASFNRGSTASTSATARGSSSTSGSNDSAQDPAADGHGAAKGGQHMTWQLFRAALTMPNLRSMFVHTADHAAAGSANSTGSNSSTHAKGAEKGSSNDAQSSSGRSSSSKSARVTASVVAPQQQQANHQHPSSKKTHAAQHAHQQSSSSSNGSSGKDGSSSAGVQKGLSLLDKTLLQLTYGGASQFSLIEDLVTGLQGVRDSMTTQEWLEFCAAAQRHRLNALMAQQAPAATGLPGAGPTAASAAATDAASAAALPVSAAAQPASAAAQPASAAASAAASADPTSAGAAAPPALASLPLPGTASSNILPAAQLLQPPKHWQQQQQPPQEEHEQQGQQQQQEQQALQLQRQASTGSSVPARLPTYDHLVFSGGGARCLAYAGAVHRLWQLGMLPRLKSVSGASGGAVFALLAALQCEPAEVLEMMAGLPEKESISWFGLNARMGLTQGEATFGAIAEAIAKKLGVDHPTLRDVANHKGIQVALAATSLSQRAPVYLSSTTHGDLSVFDALRMSCAIPLFFSPVRLGTDLLVDGCITDCVPINGLGPGVDLARVLVLSVNDEQQLDADFQGMLYGLVATCLQAGWHRQRGVDLINLWSSVAGVHPLQFRVPEAQARDVVTRSAALAEEFAALKTKSTACRSAGGACGEGGACSLPVAPAIDANASTNVNSGSSSGSGSGGSSSVVAAVLATFGSEDLDVPGRWDESVLLG